ncbi:flavin reductase family protein [Gordonia sp. CPCC 205515]|uniref:flavin reductase family protein n=1 Tax=Gordonia sp. CPCC 205515 TaxID=3140791 RepID=UPI003AF33402
MPAITPIAADNQIRHAFGHFPSGVTAVCAEIDGEKIGLAASSFTGVSLEPALVSVCMQHSSTTWPRLRTAKRLGLSVLAEGHDAICGRLASKNGDRFAGTDVTVDGDGSLFIDGASLWLDSTIYAELPCGDHDIVVLQVHGAWTGTASPLVFHGSRFRRLAALEGAAL